MGIITNAAGRLFGEYVGSKIVGKAVKTVTGRRSKFAKKIGGALGGDFGSLSSSGIPIIGSFKKGGKVKKTGAYILHKGERVIPVRRRKH